MDLDKIVSDMEQVLDFHGRSFNHMVIQKYAEDWRDNKETLTNLLRKHPAWNEEALAVAFDHDSERDIDVCQYQTKFSDIWTYNLNPNFGADIQLVIDYLYWHPAQFIDEEMVYELHIRGLDVAVGKKMSRVINQVFCSKGLDKYPNYNKDFAILADSLNPLKITRHTLLSVNPCDYLNMSYGNSWSSCHCIDNDRSHCYQAGTLSYMLDSVSMVFYTVDKDYEGNRFFEQPKINRQMYMYEGGTLLQSRLYPNYEDKANRDNFRNTVQSVIAEAEGQPNLWTPKPEDDRCQYIFTAGFSMHYPDYNYACYHTKVSLLKGKESYPALEIGHAAYCVDCGKQLSDSDNISCCRGGYKCSDCGEWIDDDIIWIDDEPYCQNCRFFCDDCDDWCVGEGTTVEGGNVVCRSCLDAYFYCEDCNEWCFNETSICIQNQGRDICEYCFEHGDYHFCAGCDDAFSEDYMEQIDDEWYCKDCAEKKKEEENQNESENDTENDPTAA